MNYSLEDNQKAVRFVIDYLTDNPDFFRRHPDVFSHMSFPRQNREGTRSIIECQNEVLRATLTTMEVREEENKLREKALSEAKDTESVLDLAISLLACEDNIGLPDTALEFFKNAFDASYGLIRLWPARPNFAFFPYAERLGPEIEESIAQMEGPFAGKNFGDEIAAWLKVDPSETRGVLLLPLKKQDGKVFGLICLCDPDEKKFSAAQREPFLRGASRVCGAALAPLTE